MKTINRLFAAGLTLFLASFVSAQDAAPPKERLLNRADIVAANPFEGIYSKRLYTDTVYITMVTVEAGRASGHHNHPDEQTMLFHTGRVRAFVGENEYEVGPGDILIIPSYVAHHFEAIEDATWTEVHGPGFNNSAKWAASDD